MGFFKGFAGGAVFTSTAVYMTLQYHHAERHYQRLLLREQIDSINDIALPSSAFSAQGRTSLQNEEARAAVMTRKGYIPKSRESKPSIIELAKERWNEDVIRFAHWLGAVRWADIERKAEDGIVFLIQSLSGRS